VPLVPAVPAVELDDPVDEDALEPLAPPDDTLVRMKPPPRCAPCAALPALVPPVLPAPVEPDAELPVAPAPPVALLADCTQPVRVIDCPPRVLWSSIDPLVPTGDCVVGLVVGEVVLGGWVVGDWVVGDCVCAATPTAMTALSIVPKMN